MNVIVIVQCRSDVADWDVFYYCRPRSPSKMTRPWSSRSSFSRSSGRDTSLSRTPTDIVSAALCVSCIPVWHADDRASRVCACVLDEGVIDKKTWLAFLDELEHKSD